MLTLTEALLELYHWKITGSTSFHGALYNLICKADPDNFKSLSLAFPAECLAWKMWQDSKNEEQFFKKISQDDFSKLQEGAD